LNISQQVEVIKGLQVPEETKQRMDCPFCHNTNTLLIDTTDDKISWYCFHASCSAKGRHQGEKTMRYVNKTFTKQETSGEAKKFIMPDSFKSIYSNENAIKYLQKNNCWDSYSMNRADIKYDVNKERVVFMVKNKYSNEYTGAVGRALNKNTYPKWFMYGSKNVPFICGQSDDAVIVEDCPSACAVSGVLTGVAIMGTSLSETHLSHIKQFKTIYVALDRDATTKSFAIVKELRSKGFDNVKVKNLTEDLKYYNSDDIRNIFYGEQNDR
jgi:DNA primase